MNKREKLSFSLALILNLIIIFIIPEYKLEKILDKRLKVGLVAFEKKNLSQKKKIVEKKSIKTLKENTIEKAELLKKQKMREKVLEKSKQRALALNSISKTMKSKNFISIDIVNEKRRRVYDNNILDSIKADKKEMTFEKENKIGFDSKNIKLDDNLKKNEIKEEIENKIFIDESSEEFLKENLKIDNKGIEGLPSGYKLGVLDGDVIAKWDKNNREPSYPEAAELKGLQGTVRVKLDLDEKGNVKSLIMEKGSGVPEINSAIESIGRTWKIYLSKHGLSIKGSVIIDYTFKLEGGS